LIIATPLSAVGQQYEGIAPDDCLMKVGPRVVIKAVPKPNNTTYPHHTIVDDPLAEISALQLLQHHHDHESSHVITLLDCLEDDAFIYLVLPYLTGGDLFDRVQSAGDGGLDEAQAADYMRQMTMGLLFMKQTANLAHHDISLENVVLSGEGKEVATIVDLGMCIKVPSPLTYEGERESSSSSSSSSDSDGEATSDSTTTTSTSSSAPLPPVRLYPRPCHGKPSLLPPEIVKEEPCDPYAADIWSLGVCLYTMCTGR